MKNRILRNWRTGCMTLAAFLLSALFGVRAIAQNSGVNDFATLEKAQDKRMDYLKQLDKITKAYPLFSYKYEIEDGQVKDVTVTGVDNEIDTRKIKVVLLDLQSSKNMLQHKANRLGVFYSVDEHPEYNDNNGNLTKTLQDYLKYPEDAKDWGVEGTIFVRFVVDENGNIPYASTTDNINSIRPGYVKDLEQQAVSAIRKTSGQWEPGKINGVKVPSFMVIPIRFDLKKSPGIPIWVS